METQAQSMSEADLEREVLPVVHNIHAIEEIANGDEYIRANQFLIQIGEARKRVEAYWKPMIDKAFALHRELTGKRKAFTDKLDQAQTVCKRAIQFYDDEQERIRKEEERKAREKAEAEDAKERAKLEKKAEKALDKGDEEKAEQLLDEAEQVHVPMPIIPSAVPTVAGTKKVTRWRAIVIDKAKVPDAFKIVDQAALNRYANSTKGQMPVAGVRFESETTTERTGRF